MPDSDPQRTRSRQRILESAVQSLGDRGLSGEVLKSAAEAAHVPIARARLFFRNDEELILAIYLRLATDLQVRTEALSPGGVAERFREIMLAKLELAGPFREAFAGLFAKMLDPRANIGVLSPQTEPVRIRARSAFATVVRGADDAPAGEDADHLIQGFYAAHLALLLLWSQDRSADLKSTHKALELVSKLAALVCRFRWTPLSHTVLDNAGAVCGPLLDPPADAETTALSQQILRAVLRHRRVLPGATACAGSRNGEPCEQCLEPHLPLVRRFVGARLPIQFVLPAFPAKSPNLEKVLGPDPDMAEQQALQFLEGLCGEIRKIYSPGARITICSDGLVFGDLVGVPGPDIYSYGEQIAGMIERLELGSLETFNMQEIFTMKRSRATRCANCSAVTTPSRRKPYV